MDLKISLRVRVTVYPSYEVMKQLQFSWFSQKHYTFAKARDVLTSLSVKSTMLDGRTERQELPLDVPSWLILGEADFILFFFIRLWNCMD